MAEIKLQKNPVRSPLHIPFSEWKRILSRYVRNQTQNHLAIISAGVAFYAFLSIFPALVALISIYGLAFDIRHIEQQLVQLAGLMPQEALEIVKKQLEDLVSTSGGTLSLGTAAGILISLWSANKGTKAMFTGIEMAYEVENKRGFIQQNALSLLFTFGIILLVILSMAFIVAFPAFVDYLPIPQSLKELIGWLRWVVLALIVVSYLSTVYKYAPDRRTPKARWVVLGALLATLFWLIASWGFSFYVSNFGNYGEVYGSISAVVVLMLWIFLSSYLILLGAQLNSEVEKPALNLPPKT